MKYKKFNIEKKSDNSYWVNVEFDNGEKWYPRLIDRAIEDVLIGICEEIKYPQAKNYNGWKYNKEFINEIMIKLIDKYCEKIIWDGINELNMNKYIIDIINDVHEIYKNYDPTGKTKSLKESVLYNK